MFVVHPVTWKALQACAWLSTRAAIAGGSFLPVPRGSRNFAGASQGATGLAAFLGEGDFCLLPGKRRPGRPPLRQSLLHQRCRLLWRPSLPRRASRGLYPKLVLPTRESGVRVCFPPSSCTWDLGLYLHPQPKCCLGDEWARCLDSSVLSVHPLCHSLVLMETPWGLPEKDRCL